MVKIGQIWWAPNFLGRSAALLSALQGCSHLLLPLLGPTTLALANLKLGKTRRFSKMSQPVEFSDKNIMSHGTSYFFQSKQFQTNLQVLSPKTRLLFLPVAVGTSFLP
jgi:hypothetical protein